VDVLTGVIRGVVLDDPIHSCRACGELGNTEGLRYRELSIAHSV
jgi:hypothetical protein